MFPQTNPAPGFKTHPDHEVSTQAYRGIVIISVDDQCIAKSENALQVFETNHSPVIYLPLEDINNDLLIDSNHVTRCPFKGKAKYWNIRIGDHEIDNALWAYEMPFDEVLELAGMAAFYDNKVKVELFPD